MIYAATLNSAVIPPTLSCESAAIYDCDYEIVIYAKKGEQSMHPASTTKVATLLYCLSLKPDRGLFFMVAPEVLRVLPKEKKIALNYAIDPYILEPDATLVGLVPHGIYSINDLYHALELISANDAANALAHYLGGGSIEAFMLRLNEFLVNIGCEATTLVNPNGLEYPSHRTTAIDMAKIYAHGLKDPEFMEIMGKVSFTFGSKEVLDPALQTFNVLIRPEKDLFYKYCIGGKTGYTENAGFCFTGAAKNRERTLSIALMRSTSSKERFIDAINLFNAAFEEKKEVRTFYNKADPCFYLKPINRKISVALQLEEELMIETFASRLAVLEPTIILDEVAVPIAKGQVCGRVDIVTPKGKVVLSKPLFAAEAAGHTIWTLLAQYRYETTLLFIALSIGFFIVKRILSRRKVQNLSEE